MAKVPVEFLVTRMYLHVRFQRRMNKNIQFPLRINIIQYPLFKKISCYSVLCAKIYNFSFFPLYIASATSLQIHQKISTTTQPLTLMYQTVVSLILSHRHRVIHEHDLPQRAPLLPGSPSGDQAAVHQVLRLATGHWLGRYLLWPRCSGTFCGQRSGASQAHVRSSLEGTSLSMPGPKPMVYLFFSSCFNIFLMIYLVVCWAASESSQESASWCMCGVTY